ncbi:hypothetical protein [Clostridium thermopalmarium]|uniref:Uncharacterized protein n=1 Tax=Clostridium thermopalmarium DSM 5974 TaxID=1121340 RepID=A0A2T0APF8_9CLOT|nr:hypothetical protein [Clostridium thermopalmarium]PRR70899.1 hypothetical protein CPAL_19890 [Clostridium thermopalmarium DSM 5974]PVZ28823.1 hypothetical protein LX19_00127 [Clostridium thermopalmarium DSM 5974]
MLALVIIIAMISVSVSITCYRYSIIKAKETMKKINRPDLIQMRRVEEHDRISK